MPDEPGPDEERRPVGLARAIRHAFAAYLDEIVLFLAVNLILVVAVALLVASSSIVPPLLLLAPLLALPTAVLMRLAVEGARETAVSWATVREELGRLAWRKVVLATVQLLILGIAATNVSLSSGIGGVPGILSALVAGYALIAISVYAVALWPIVCDPRREGPLREQLRLAVAVVLVRPLQVGVLAVITVLAVIASVQLIAPGLFLASLVLLAIAAYVVDVADRLRPLEG
ncbi:MAG: hypothetical protein ACRDE6_06625 [Candidatus Limnocylindria bacterium]